MLIAITILLAAIAIELGIVIFFVFTQNVVLSLVHDKLREWHHEWTKRQ